MKNISREIVGNGMFRYVRLRPCISWKMVTDFGTRCKVSNSLDHKGLFASIRQSIRSQLENEIHFKNGGQRS